MTRPRPKRPFRLAASLRALLLGAQLALAPIATLVAAGCSVPSVPLPPPTVDTSALGFSAPAEGQAVLTGIPRVSHASARFFVYNLQTGDGVITTAAADGSFTTPAFAAKLGDVAQIHFEQTDGDKSETICVTVLFSQSLLGTGCP